MSLHTAVERRTHTIFGTYKASRSHWLNWLPIGVAPLTDGDPGMSYWRGWRHAIGITVNCFRWGVYFGSTRKFHGA